MEKVAQQAATFQKRYGKKLGEQARWILQKLATKDTSDLPNEDDKDQEAV